MKKQLMVITLLLAISYSAALAEDRLGVEVATSFYGKYIWRGQNITDEPVFQPAVTLSRGPLSGGVWANMDLTNVNDQSGEFIEYDYWLDYSADLAEGVGFSLGTIHYYFPGLPSTTELYWGLNFDLPLSPALTVYHDVDQVNGTYVNFGLSHSIERIAELSPEVPIGLDLSASLGWGSASYNEGYWGIEDCKVNDMALSAGLPMQIAGWTVTPGINYITLLSDAIRKTDAFNKSSDYLFAGITLSMQF